MRLAVDRLDSPAGPIVIVASATGLVAVDFGEPEERLWEMLRRRFGAVEAVPAPDPLGASSALRAYLAGRLDALDDLPVDAGGTPFQQECWAALRTIPAGTTWSYRQLARRDRPAGGGARGRARQRRQPGRDRRPLPPRDRCRRLAHRLWRRPGAQALAPGARGRAAADRRVKDRRMLTLYDYLSSGNGYKCRLLLHQLGIPYRRVELDILKGETRTPEFLAKNPNGRVPTLELEDGTLLAESNAILFYLADGTPFLPDGPARRGRRCCSGCSSSSTATSRSSPSPASSTTCCRRTRPRRAELPRLEQGGHAALGVHGAAAGRAPVPGRRPLHDRGHRPLRLHARRATRAASISRPIPASGPGCSAWRPSRGMCRSRRLGMAAGYQPPVTFGGATRCKAALRVWHPSLDPRLIASALSLRPQRSCRSAIAAGHRRAGSCRVREAVLLQLSGCRHAHDRA